MQKPECYHKRQKYTDGEWICSNCGSVAESNRDGIKEIIDSKQFPQLTPPVEPYFSATLGEMVYSNADYKEKLNAITDPDRNPEHLTRETPDDRRKYNEECMEKGVMP